MIRNILHPFTKVDNVTDENGTGLSVLLEAISSAVVALQDKLNEFISGNVTSDGVVHKYVTQEEYDTLVANDEINNSYIYLIPEEDSSESEEPTDEETSQNVSVSDNSIMLTNVSVSDNTITLVGSVNNDTLNL